MDERSRFWESVYSRPVDQVSWYQAAPETSLELIDHLGLPLAAAVIDVGGGASTLVDHLLATGRGNVTVLDVSASALRAARQRVRTPDAVTWIREDVLVWEPQERFVLWHDRAVLHFLIDASDRLRYFETLRRALTPAGAVVIGTFALDGPDHCSGLPVCRYAAEDLMTALGAEFALVETTREEHLTPSGTVQPFTWVSARRGPPEEAPPPAY